MSPVWLVLALLPMFGGAERFNCRTRILGAYYADAKSGCKAFHVCVRVAGGGIRDFRFYCPPGTLFHQEAQTCTDWGDDDPLACPADIYDAYDTKKVTSSNREEESEFGLQKAETGDRRLQNNLNSGASDLRTAHSSDFFSGQRDRGRDEPQQQQSPAPQQPASNVRQSFRRPTTQQPTNPTTQYTSPQPTFPPQPVNPSNYEQVKRKVTRKRPIYSSSTPSNDYAFNTFQPQSSSEQQKHDFNRKQQSYEQTKQDAPRKQQSYLQSKQDVSRNAQNYFKPQKQDSFRQPQAHPDQQRQDFDRQQKSFAEPPKQDYNRQPQNYPEQPKKDFNRRPQANTEQSNQNVNRQPGFENIPNPPSVKNLPPQYQDEYVEVPRVSPKNTNRHYTSNPSSPSHFSSTPAPNQANNQKGLVELYNYDSQSTPGIKQNENKAFKLRNSFNVQSGPSKDDNRNRNYYNGGSSTAAVDFNGLRGTSTPSYLNFNSVSYEPEKNNFLDFSTPKTNYYYTTTTTPFTTTIFTTTRFEPLNVNTIAYNTNIGFDTQSPSFSESIEDDGQYRPPQGEDDGQYRPELYERESELLTGAHSLNIAASNRLPEEQKHRKNKEEKTLSKQSRPFRPVPTPFTTSTTPAPENYPTTPRQRQEQSTQRTFDYYQTYTTTSRPYDAPSAPEHHSVKTPSAAPKLSTEPAPRQTSRPINRETYSTSAPVNVPKSTKRPHFANPPNKKEDSSYDYAYYDSDPGFSEYDQIEEFGRTKSKL
ncbi:eukaryotic translation initiation factor 4 gamma-like isoform X2 [Aricia agestis]|uniref:eukaryotic translation initiation factor 4 gamma-like isoform X2 n=1 Tax=Aricia agestis TaxID=91739 RepID=UPI001C206DE2|nr:eukaryotic translation initiation factor 4 gamma-like isoform X2 [Aricia agestis]